MAFKVATKRPKQLFNKNTGLCKLVRGSIESDVCPVLEGQWEKLAVRRRFELKPQ